LLGLFEWYNSLSFLTAWMRSLDFLLLRSFARYNARISGAALPRPTACVCYVHHALHPFPAWIGGHGSVPYEQNTQQSPCLGFSSELHDVHS